MATYSVPPHGNPVVYDDAPGASVPAGEVWEVLAPVSEGPGMKYGPLDSVPAEVTHVKRYTVSKNPADIFG